MKNTGNCNIKSKKNVSYKALGTLGEAVSSGLQSENVKISGKKTGNKPSSLPFHDRLYRPSLHFTPDKGFMNDPNGLVYDGRYFHLYYQYDPIAPFAGNVHWGHAVSTDLYHWQDKPIAVNQTQDGQAFSGSAVNDSQNHSGLFPHKDNGGLVAIFTRSTEMKQSQYVAYSCDGGEHFSDYVNNPVLDVGSTSFRDPKVFWHAPSQKWVMVVSHARAHKLSFYGSYDLLSWMHLSDFGPDGVFAVDYECPGLAEIRVEGGKSGETRWVLFLSVNPGAALGGSSTEYFIGHFDGERFIPEDRQVRMTDFAKECYALQTYNDMPGGDAVYLAWMSNWQYTEEVPTETWRGAMTLPRQMVLKHDEYGELRLVQTPYGLEALRQPSVLFDLPYFTSGEKAEVSLPPNQPFELVMDVSLEDIPETHIRDNRWCPPRFSLTFANQKGEEFSIGVDAIYNQLWLDRSKLRGFDNPFFTGQFSASLPQDARDFQLQIILDGSTLEIYANGGTVVGTALVYPDSPLETVTFRTEFLSARVTHAALYPLKKTMERITLE
ncbi:glycoside hydrolase family 32 protein [Acetobacteraceae bacterium ESL0709]|nr:glycoside hydrolase family 32 protein [Acetobacteraceae bacterium ESL0697]MDF7679000.1 glycoside hydrolase family 32 protein [Acetobacteraceae bacterium ESL0709]